MKPEAYAKSSAQLPVFFGEMLGLKAQVRSPGAADRSTPLCRQPSRINGSFNLKTSLWKRP